MQALGQTAISSLLLVAPVLSSFNIFFFFFCLKCLCCLTLVADDDDDDDDDDRYDVMPQRIPLHFYAQFVCVFALFRRFALICSTRTRAIFERRCSTFRRRLLRLDNRL